MMFWVLLSCIVNLSALVMLGKWKRNGSCFCSLFIHRVATHTYTGTERHTTLLLSSLYWILCFNSLERVQKYAFLGIHCIVILLLIIFDLVCMCLHVYMVFSGHTCIVSLTFRRCLLLVHPCVCHGRWPVSLKRFCSALIPSCNKSIKITVMKKKRKKKITVMLPHLALLGSGDLSSGSHASGKPFTKSYFQPLDLRSYLGRHILFNVVQHQSVSSRLGNFGFLSFPL